MSRVSEMAALFGGTSVAQSAAEWEETQAKTKRELDTKVAEARDLMEHWKGVPGTETSRVDESKRVVVDNIKAVQMMGLMSAREAKALLESLGGSHHLVGSSSIQRAPGRLSVDKKAFLRSSSPQPSEGNTGASLPSSGVVTERKKQIERSKCVQREEGDLRHHGPTDITCAAGTVKRLQEVYRSEALGCEALRSSGRFLSESPDAMPHCLPLFPPSVPRVPLPGLSEQPVTSTKREQVIMEGQAREEETLGERGGKGKAEMDEVERLGAEGKMSVHPERPDSLPSAPTNPPYDKGQAPAVKAESLEAVRDQAGVGNHPELPPEKNKEEVQEGLGETETEVGVDRFATVLQSLKDGLAQIQLSAPNGPGATASSEEPCAREGGMGVEGGGILQSPPDGLSATHATALAKLLTAVVEHKKAVAAEQAARKLEEALQQMGMGVTPQGGMPYDGGTEENGETTGKAETSASSRGRVLRELTVEDLFLFKQKRKQGKSRQESMVGSPPRQQQTPERGGMKWGGGGVGGVPSSTAAVSSIKTNENFSPISARILDVSSGVESGNLKDVDSREGAAGGAANDGSQSDSGRSEGRLTIDEVSLSSFPFAVKVGNPAVDVRSDVFAEGKSEVLSVSGGTRATAAGIFRSMYAPLLSGPSATASSAVSGSVRGSVAAMSEKGTVD
uniref:Uncharacterized protein n=1 Tax=Chromera velia CCMP2878 TaxID=1169474 RepID=A0A0G4G674_9ALVE|eukprot:Cvel_20430.t1-p1 / transcript=Cvel_20430.t1 / gene=Cvel_20430 / organism=Chromera_velia_CCMP2878 / gene_product=hypothetical protein / transcript_product=hypothetical protein / location=Cvel_scaffold1831:12950-15317(-) / protein_length=675 / sequence_SO=supercontig / SO=protein_coding / is_pseudo=false